MQNSDIDERIDAAQCAAIEFFGRSDAAFSRGDFLSAIKYTRWARLAEGYALELLARAGRASLASH